MPKLLLSAFNRPIRLLAALLLGLGLLGLNPTSPSVMAAPAPAPAAQPASTPSLGLLPSPVPTVIVTTSSISDNPADGQCDLWEALQAVFQANFDLLPAYHECAAIPNAPNVIGFSPAVLGSTVQVPDTVHSGDLPFAWGDTTILGPITIKASATNTDTHLLQTASDANLTLIAVSLSNAHTSGGGAAILDLNHATINLFGSNITGNSADNDGGAINSNGNVNVVLSNFSGNQALGVGGGAGYGGAIVLTGAGTLSIAKSNFAGNIAKAGGGALYSTTPNAVIEDSLFSGNLGGQDINLNKGGGAIYNDGSGGMAIARTQFAGNLAPQGNGGAVYNNAGAAMVITDTTFAANLAGDFSHATLGGAIYNQAQLNVFRSSFVNNISVKGDGGGLVVDRHGSADVGNSTFALNGAPSGLGGGLVVTQTQIGGPASSLTLQNDTIADNGTPTDADTGIYNAGGNNLTLGNTILDGNLNGNCAGPGTYTNALGHNLDSGHTCHLPNSNGNLIDDGNAKLGGPSFNGGPLSSMLTMKPANTSTIGGTSDAVDHGDNTICASPQVNNEDQRGETRPKGASPISPSQCDIGAFEADTLSPGYGSDPSEPATINVGTAVMNTPVTTSLVISNTGEWVLNVGALAPIGSGDFSVSTAPFPILPHTVPVNLVITCTPHGSTGSRTAELTIGSDDKPLHIANLYLLKCTGVAAPTPGYGSSPILPGPIVFKDTQAFGGSSTASFKVLETGDATLNVSSPIFTGPNAAEFHMATATPFSITDGGAPKTVTVQCAPAGYGLRSATLTFTTNDPNQTSVSYALTCKGVPPPSPFLLTTGTSMGNGGDIGLHHVFGVAVSPAGNYVYATGNNIADTAGSVAAFKRDPVTGALSFIAKSGDFFGELHWGRTIALSPDGKNAYVAAQSPFGQPIGTGGDLVQLTAQPNGAMALTHGYSPAALAGAFGVAVSPDGRSVYGTGGSVNSLVAYTRTLSTGDLNNTGFQVISSAAYLGGAAGLVVSPDGQDVYVTGYSSNSLQVLHRNPLNGTLSNYQTRKQGDTQDGPALTGMTGANRVAISADGTSVYVASYTDGAIVAFSRNLVTGALTWHGTYKCGCGGTNGLQGAYGIDVTPDGLHVIAAGSLANAVVVFDRDPGDGTLTYHEQVSKANNGLPLGDPQDVHVSPDGRTVYVTAYTDDSIVVLPIANPTPLLTNISPASAPLGGASFTMHIYGANFIPTSQVGGYAAAYISPNQLDVTVPASTLSSAGPKIIQVRNPQPVGDFMYSIPFYLQVIPPANHPIPAIDHITPQGQLAGGNGLALDVYGSGFINGSSVLWNGSSRTTTFIDSGHLQASIPQSDVSQPGTSSVMVTTGGPGGGPSNQVPFTVAQPGQNAVPTLTTLNPVWVFSHGAGSKQIQLTVTGQNFIEGSTVQLDGVNRPTLFVDSSHLKATIFGSDLAVPASTAITVFTPGPGGGTSNPLTFTIKKLYSLFLPIVRR